MSHHHTASSAPDVEKEAFAAQAQGLLHALCPRDSQSSSTRKPGRPPQLSSPHLWIGLLLCILRGMDCQHDLWRLLSWEGFGNLSPLKLSDQAIYKRLAQEGVKPLEQLWLATSQLLAKRLAPYAPSDLAPFAAGVFALDETVLDPIARALAPLRGLPKGDTSLIPGKIACLFDVRLQQWCDFRFLADASQHCCVHARDLLRLVPAGSLLLADRGYFSFAWFDFLTQNGYFWISRQRTHTRTQLIEIFYQQGEIFDGLVWLGGKKDQAAYAVRLVQFRLGASRYCYLTNVLDPTQLSVAQIARLYARRWDIELTFRTIKEHLGLRLLWSSKLVVIQEQCLACLIVAQLLQAFQVELAARAEVDPFDVSIALLLKVVPPMLLRGQEPLARLLAEGRAMGVIRPSSRRRWDLGPLPFYDMSRLPADLVLVRPARYAHSGKQKQARWSN